MKIHPHALPSVMDWPSFGCFKVDGKYLLDPDEWRLLTKRPTTDIDYDYSTVSPLKKIKS